MSIARKLRRDMLSYYDWLHREYGDMVCMRLGPYRYYVAYHPDQVKELLVTKAKSFHMSPTVRRVIAQWDGNGLITSEGDFWLRQRRLMQPAFSARRFNGYAQMMTDEVQRVADRWAQQIETNGVLEVDVDRAMTDLTLSIVSRTLFGADLELNTAEIGRAVAVLSETAVREMQAPVHTPDWLPTTAKRKKRWASRLLDETVRGFIRHRRASGEDRGDLLSMLLLAVDHEGGSGGMTDEQARDECMTLFLAGHDTSAAGLTWTFYNLAKHPAVAKRLQDEVDTVLGGRTPGYDDLPDLPFTEMVVKEAVRLYPPAIGVFLREALEEVVIGGYPLRKGDLIQVISYVIHRDPRWFPDPLRFDPERFSPDRVEEIPQFAYFPFGGGPRVCIGSHFAMMEMRLVAAMLLQRFDVRLADHQGEVQLLPQMSLRPRGGLRLTFSRRAEVPAVAMA
jgi:cytochrome P450